MAALSLFSGATTMVLQGCLLACAACVAIVARAICIEPSRFLHNIFNLFWYNRGWLEEANPNLNEERGEPDD
jgi:hypothetical protein